jgi:glycosyltransferase involved in cell wall biosynthesis
MTKNTGQMSDIIIGFDAKRVFHNKTGLGNYSRDLIRILSEKYPQNRYLLYNPKPAKKQLFSLSGNDVIERLPSKAFHSFFYNYWRQFGIKKDLLIDVVQVFHGLTGEIPYGLKKSGIKSVVTVHDLIFLRYPQFYSFFDRIIHTLKARYAVNHADMVVAVSEQTKRDIVTFFKIDPNKIRVIYQGCQDIFHQEMSDEFRRQLIGRFNLPTSFILNVGTIEERKNILSVVKVLQHIDTHLVIVGSETDYTLLVKKYINEHNLESKVTFLKGVSSQELAALYRSAQLFVYPSLFEGFGIPIIEALYSGTPVITSKGSCFGEAGGKGSIYVDPLNCDELQDAIVNVLEDATLRAQMIKEGKDYVARFNSGYIGDSYIELYKILIHNSL